MLARAPQARRAPSSPAASSRCSPSPGCCAWAPGCCCCDEPTRVSPRCSCSRSARSSARSRQHGVAVLLVEQNVTFAADRRRPALPARPGPGRRAARQRRVRAARERAARVPRHLTDRHHHHDHLQRSHEHACRQEPRIAAVADHGAVVLACCCRRRRRRPARRRRAKLTDDKIVLGRAQRPVRRLQGPVRPELRSRRSRWRSPTTRPSTATRRSPRTSRSSPPTTRTSRTSPTPRRRRCTTGRSADVILDVPTSSAALAVADVGQGEEEALLQHRRGDHRADRRSSATSTPSTTPTTPTCSPTAPARRSTEDGGKNWYIVYPDYAFGQDMEKSLHRRGRGRPAARSAQAIADAVPERQLRDVHHQGAGADPKPGRLGTMQAGGDLINLVKQYNEFELRDKGIGLAVGLMFITDIHSLGVGRVRRHHVHRRLVLELRRAEPGVGRPVHRRRPAPGRRSRTPATTPPRCSTSRPCRPPAPTTPTPSSKQLEGKKINDVFLRNGEIRAEDHRVIHDAYLAKVKPKAEVKEDWDYEEIIRPSRRPRRSRPRPPARCEPATGVGRRSRPRTRKRDMDAFLQYTVQGLAAGGFYALPPSAWPSSSACSAWSTSPTARSTCSARSARPCCSTSSAAASGSALVVVPLADVRRSACVLERLLVHWLLAARPALQLPAHLRPDADPAGPGQAASTACRPARTSRRPGSTGRSTSGRFDFPAYQVFVLVVLGGRLRRWCGCCSPGPGSA